MPEQETSAASGTARHSRVGRGVLLVLVAAGLLFMVGSVAGWLYLHHTNARMLGLEGTGRDGGSSRHTYQFRANGDVDSWYGSLPMGKFMKWDRNGNTVTVKTERNWGFVGELRGNEIRGKTIIRNETGQPEQEVDSVWRRE